ncbi:hypothetical protein [uncultured Fibrobacter sp.]|uniref:hypothetical protein n=1 Tax=uncultured Fibrobacter sp. TaxID=261512 RepID=UPI00260341C6|nr:hypothetical protein [uncultured Fibrobacter sp.]
MRVIFSILIVAVLAASAMAAEETSERDRSKLSIFLQPSVSFLDFPEREYFQNAIDTLYYSFKEDALTESESLSVAKQDFQKVNFCFPIAFGIQYQVFRNNFISAGVSYIYDNESVVLTDRKSRSHNYSYTIQGIPMFLEYRLGIPRNLMTLSGESLFSIGVRWYWILPGTEIYSTWGKVEAKTPLWGSGFGISVGYLIASWKNFNIYGDIGFSSIKVESNGNYSDIVPDGPKEKAKWNIGGLTMQVRVGFGLWNEPEPVEEDDDDDDVPDGDSATVPPTTAATTTVADTTAADSTVADTTTVDTTPIDTTSSSEANEKSPEE